MGCPAMGDVWDGGRRGPSGGLATSKMVGGGSSSDEDDDDDEDGPPAPEPAEDAAEPAAAAPFAAAVAPAALLPAGLNISARLNLGTNTAALALGADECSVGDGVARSPDSECDGDCSAAGAPPPPSSDSTDGGVLGTDATLGPPRGGEMGPPAAWAGVSGGDSSSDPANAPAAAPAAGVVAPLLLRLEPTVAICEAVARLLRLTADETLGRPPPDPARCGGPGRSAAIPAAVAAELPVARPGPTGTPPLRLEKSLSGR
jgi:hypothetical protein